MPATTSRHTQHPLWPRIDALLEPWRTLDVPRIAATFTPDGVLHSVMGTPIRGHASLVKVLGRHLGRARSLEFEIVNLAVAGDVVFLERIDHLVTPEGRHAIPVVSVLVLQGERIREWREYFDSVQAGTALSAARVVPPPSA